MNTTSDEKPSPQQAWEATKKSISSESPKKLSWVELGRLKKFHEGLFIIEFPASAMDEARKLHLTSVSTLNHLINRELSEMMGENCEILTMFAPHDDRPA